jgi:hypothetical protein
MIAGLQDRAIELKAALRRLEARQPILSEQMRTASNGGFRAAAEHELNQARLQIVDVQAELEAVQERLQLLTGQRPVGPGTPMTAPPSRPPTFVDKLDRDAVSAVMVMTTLALMVPLSVGLARRLWRRPVDPAPAKDAMDSLNVRFDRLEQAVDTIAIEIERVSENQRFVAKVLSERPSPPAPVPHARADGEAALGDAKPFLALGAGPIEAIPVVQRQAVKQSITPH